MEKRVTVVEKEKPKQLYLPENDSQQLNSCTLESNSISRVDSGFKKDAPGREFRGIWRRDYTQNVDRSLEIPHLIRSNQVVRSTIAQLT